MARQAIVCMLVAACSLGATMAGTAPATAADECPGSDAQPNQTSLKAERVAIICLINSERERQGAGLLSRSRRLTRTASARSHEMIRRRYFGHERTGGPSFAQRIRRSGYLSDSTRRSKVGENLAWGIGPHSTPRAIVAAWMASPKHRVNLLDASFQELGVGVARGVPDPSNHPTRERLSNAMVVTADFGAHC